MREDLPGKAIVYMDGQDARFFKKLARVLRSEEKAQYAMIFTGLFARSPREKMSPENEREVMATFKEIVGCDYGAFQKLVETL